MRIGIFLVAVGARRKTNPLLSYTLQFQDALLSLSKEHLKEKSNGLRSLLTRARSIKPLNIYLSVQVKKKPSVRAWVIGRVAPTPNQKAVNVPTINTTDAKGLRKGF